ncbi:hypothetical protein [Variovorax sp. Root411]|uniref:hypothetical protein n=1 Tax=Variovorax sp. Root411 TaxID=1736530 RepID=UPI0006F2EC27|nr:hypothetical protein [Variovorax sp. Root411]KQW63549.1 hypothetical protein ASC92_23560 [Variovorax sp. Root411]
MHLSSGFVGLVLMGATLFALIGIPLVASGATRRKEIAKLVETGQRTSAEIVGYISGGGGKGQCIVFSFTPLGAAESSKYAKLIYGFRRLKAGDRVEVCYDKEFPFLSALIPLGDRQDVGSQRISER